MSNPLHAALTRLAQQVQGLKPILKCEISNQYHWGCLWCGTVWAQSNGPHAHPAANGCLAVYDWPALIRMAETPEKQVAALAAQVESLIATLSQTQANLAALQKATTAPLSRARIEAALTNELLQHINRRMASGGELFHIRQAIIDAIMPLLTKPRQQEAKTPNWIPCLNCSGVGRLNRALGANDEIVFASPWDCPICHGTGGAHAAQEPRS